MKTWSILLPEEGEGAVEKNRGESADKRSGEPRGGLQALEALGVHAKRVEAPSSREEVQRILGQAFKEGLKVIPLGGGTALGVAAIPETVDIAMDMTGMGGIPVLDPKNLNMTVQAGKTVDAINGELAEAGKGFFLPMDPPMAAQATIGGVYASNSSGPLRLLYGTLRDQALGVQGVNAQGQAVAFGGVTVKNVSGYDLTKFLIGSAGTLCVVTSIAIRILPIPDASSVCELFFEKADGLDDFLTQLRASVLVPSGVVIASSSSGAQGLRAVVAFEGHAAAVERQSGDLLRMAQGKGGKGEAKMSRETMLQTLRGAVDPNGLGTHSLALKVSVPIMQGTAVHSAIHKLASRGELQIKMALLAGNGVLFVYAGGDADDVLVQFSKGVREAALRMGGHAVPIRGTHAVLAAWGPRVDPTLQRQVLKPIKQILDPKGILLPLV
jgi:glycolate oxidase FAD binding subunit